MTEVYSPGSITWR